MTSCSPKLKKKKKKTKKRKEKGKKKKENVEKTLQLSDQFDINQNNIFFVCVNVFMVLNKIKTEQKKAKGNPNDLSLPLEKRSIKKKKVVSFSPFSFFDGFFFSKKKKRIGDAAQPERYGDNEENTPLPPLKSRCFSFFLQ